MSIELWSQIRPGLFLGGTYETPLQGDRWAPSISPDEFQTVATFFDGAPPVGEGVKELRFGFKDDESMDIDFGTLRQVVELIWQDWVAGKSVLIRCEGGWNRSALVTAMVLMRNGLDASEAIAELRQARSANVLNNRAFESWLLAAPMTEFRMHEARDWS